MSFHDQLSRLHAASGNTVAAAQALEQAISIAPSAARHYQRGLYALQGGETSTARMHFSQAVKADGNNAEYHLQLGYLCKRERDAQCATQAFERAALLEPSRKAVYAELGYTYTQAHNNKKAVEWFKRAIDEELAQPSSAAAAPTLASSFQPVAAVQPEGQHAPATGPDTERVHRLRQQIRDMTRQYQFNVYQSYRSENGRRTSDVAPGFQTGGLIPSQGGMEFLYQPPELGYRDAKTFRIFARTLWSNKPDSLSIDKDTLQGGVGVEYKPMAARNVYLSLERLVKIGSQTQDNWLARVSWGYSDGYDMQRGKQSWNQTLAYADAGYLLQRDNIKSVYGEVRQGRSFRFQDRWMVTPHVVVAGRGQRPDPNDISYLELGAGVSFKYVFNETRYQATRSGAEFGVQYRKAVTNERAGGWLLTTALQF